MKRLKNPRANELLGRALARFRPPPRLKLSKWAESNIILPESARPGKYRNWPYFIEPLDSMADPEVEQVTVVKATRVGFTKGMVIAIAAQIATNPSQNILFVPTDEDAADYSSEEIDPIFEASEALRDLRKLTGRQTLRRKNFIGGASLSILPTVAPRNFRRRDAKNVFADEVDSMKVTIEGDPLALMKRRTMAHADRKIVFGSTPTEEGISLIEKEYSNSDQRIFETPCPHCGSMFEIQQKHLQWPKGEPEKAIVICPHCYKGIPERFKVWMVDNGAWRALKPEVKGHRGYRLRAFVSLLPGAAWGTLAKEWDAAKRGGPAEMQAYVNTVEARPWRTTIKSLTEEALAAKVEPIGLDIGEDGKSLIPADCLLLTAGIDVQDYWLEITVLGWRLPITGAKVFTPGGPYVLGHYRIEGNTLEDATWKELDEFLRSRWRHPNGWWMRLDAAAIDSGGSEGRTQKVYDFCSARLARRVYAIKGDPGPKPVWRASSSKKVKGGARLFLVGHDIAKTAVMESLSADLWITNEAGEPTDELNLHAARLSDTLTPEWFEQATGEHRKVRYVRNRAVIEFVPKKQGQRVEALDCLCYGWAVRHSPAVRAINLQERAARRPDPEAEQKKPKSAADWAAHFNQ
jgi:phage terminase large subunit GpA-like protein